MKYQTEQEAIDHGATLEEIDRLRNAGEARKAELKARDGQRPTLAGYLVTFLSTVLVYRLLIDFFRTGEILHAESWTSPVAWIGPVIFGLILVYAYHYRKTHHS